MSTGTDALAAAAQALTEALRQAAADPVDAIRLLETFVANIGMPDPTTPQAPVSAVFRRSALASIALATADYQPASSTEANAVIDQVANLMDVETTIAADNDDLQSYLALRDLRQAVITDLRARSAALPELVTIKFGASLPSLVAAYRLYSDTTREPGMVARAGVTHPGFMPPSFEALAQ